MAKIVEDISQKMLIVDRTGIYRNFAGTKTLEIRDNAIFLDKKEIGSDGILECTAEKDILHLILVDTSNHRSEHHLKYNAFIPFGAAKKTGEIAKRINMLVSHHGGIKATQKKIENAMWLKSSDDKKYIRVFSYSVKYPNKCPICLSTATHLADIQKKSTHFLIAEIETYTLKAKVPVCAVHTSLKGGIAISDLSSSESHVTYAIENEQYAKEFYELNVSP